MMMGGTLRGFSLPPWAAPFRLPSSMAENAIQHAFPRRTEIHWARKIWHMSSVFLMFVFWTLAPTEVSKIVLVVAFIAFVPVDFLRQTRPGLNDWLLTALRPIIRQNEVHKLAGTTYLITGVMLVAFVAAREVTSLTLLFLAFADPLASYVGIRFGRDKLMNNKSLQGTIAAYVVCVVLSFLFVMAMNERLDRAIVFSLVAGAVGALAELVPVAKLDDNFTLPVFSALGLSLLFYFFGFLPGVF